MRTTIWISLAGLAWAAPLVGQTDLDTAITQLRQLQLLVGTPVSAIPSAGEVPPIAGKPYSGVGRTVEYSPDGAHVDRSESNRIYRDEQGRTRRESGGGRLISIVDPVAGLAYSLQTESKTAMKRTGAPARPLNGSLQPGSMAPIRMKILNQSVRTMYDTLAKMSGINVLWDPEITPPVKNQFSVDLSNATLEQALNTVAAATKTYWKAVGPASIFVTDDTPVKVAAANAGQSPAPQMSLVEAAREQAKRMSTGGRGGNGNAANVTVDDLGTQVMNGVAAQGVRTTSIIPTGTFGNDREIKTVTERWVSEDLHVLVKSVYTDSRTGSTVYDLINVIQAPPDPSLFQVPAGYTVQEGGRGARGAVPVPKGGR